MSSNKPEAPKGNILIVDDTLENLRVLSTTLSEQGYKVRGVVNGQMALRVVRSAAPDLILLDIKMPDMNGYEICELLKADEQTCEIPVIFISALDAVLDKVRAFTVGGIDYITKPFQVEEVLARVKNQLTIRQLSQQLQEQNQRLQQEVQVRQKAEEAAAAASKAKSEFVANMSHELRTPLNAILGFTQVMLRDSTLSPEQQENVGIISRSGEHLLELIDDVLELSKIEAGIIALNEISFDLYSLLKNLEQMFQIKAEQKNLQLTFHVSPTLPRYVKTDKKKLQSCLVNLLGNAIKFTEIGSVTLRVRGDRAVRSEEESSPARYSLTFEVEDTGPGIAPAEIDNLFKAFVQTETGRRAAEGSGLGLSICQKFVELMGGGITVSSVLNQGTTFKFDIRLTITDASEVIVPLNQQVIGLEQNQPTYRILVADDTPENRLLLVKLLAPIGFEVREAENGRAAVMLWESWRPHLIWMDTRMPMMDGVTAMKEIRTREAEIGGNGISSKDRENCMPHAPTVIIALTASTFEERRGTILAAGANDFVRKPFAEGVIFAKMAEHLGLRYLYASQTTFSAGQPAPMPDSFFLSELAALPPDWVAELHQAANEVNEELVIQLIEQIPAGSLALAEALTDLIQNFRFDAIVRLANLTLR